MLVKLQSLNKTYRAAEVETTALHDVNVEIREGEFVAIMGPSGCGKSTLLNVIGMLDSPTSGSYRFRDEEISRYDEARLAGIRKRHVGFVFQSFNLIDELTVEGNIELALLYQDVSAADRKQRVREVMDRMKIAHRAKHFPAALSGGQQQRVAVARAVVSKPAL
ncbi:MAG TPA: ABC transporter ATP-binding protein, partial [Kofleriaceae bacterium]|nr:ABC transporter ATP-binding protein [Kofleriaceae bacterium]